MTARDQNTPPPALQQEFWNSWNLDTRADVELPVGIQARRAAVLEILESLPSRDQNIIEIGCGTGWLSADLQRFGKVLGVDLADQAISAARRTCPDAEFMAGDFMTLDLPQSHFGIAVCLETLSHVEDQSAFLARIADILEPGGHLVLTTQNRSVMVYVDVVPQAPGQIRKWLSMKQLKRMLRSRFDVLRAKTVRPAAGHRGVLRLSNSGKLNALARVFWSPQSIIRIKERLGLGEALVVLARRRA